MGAVLFNTAGIPKLEYEVDFVPVPYPIIPEISDPDSVVSVFFCNSVCPGTCNSE
jgi:hypothetical protein